MPQIIFATETSESRSLPLDAQRLVNFFTEKQPQGAKSQTPLFGAPGMAAFADVASVTGGIATLGSVTGGTLYTDGSYADVALTGGTGTGARANITVAGGAVTVVDLIVPGENYTAGDALSALAASIGGTGSGFSVPVASTNMPAASTGFPTIRPNGSWVKQDVPYVVSRDSLYQINQDGTVVLVGTGIDGGDGPVSMSDNGFQLCIVTGTSGYILDTNSLSPTFGFQKIVSANFYPAKTVTFFDGYFVFDRAGTNEFFLSALYDGTSYNGLDFASAETQPDFVVGTMQNLQLLFVICQAHLELWYDAGAADFPFQRYTGAGISYGCAASHTIVKQDGAIFFVGSDKVFYRLQSTVPVRTSTHAIEHIIAQDPDLSQAYCFSYTLEGHKFVVLQLPASGRTLVWDISTGKWHERESWDSSSVSLGTWRASTVFRAFGNVYFGDAFNTNVNRLDWTVYTELGNTIRGLAYSIPYHQDRKRIFPSVFELDVQAGVGLTSGQGSDPQIMLGWSVDGAQTFKPLQPWRSMGRIGQYLRRLRWLRMGQGRQFVFVLSCTDPVPRVIISAHAEFSVGM